MTMERERVIIVRYCEIHLKGKNRGYFEKVFMNNLEKALTGIRHEMKKPSGRYIVEKFDEARTDEIIDRLRKVFGTHSLSAGYQVDAEMGAIYDTVRMVAPESGSFKVQANRGDKTFPLNSVAISREVGGRILKSKPSLSVDLHNPDFIVNIDVRENGKTYVYGDVIRCSDGMPVGCSGRGLAMLSGGIDSPVACHCMAKRGLKLDLLHFHSYPYTSELAKQKVRRLAEILRPYTGPVTLMCAPLTKIQELIHAKCNTQYMITLVRVFMMRIAEKVALKRQCGCIINGESLGQVASQTLESIRVTDSQIKSLPVFRPLIGCNKEEIIGIAQNIGTFETSIEPYEDCCTVFLPDAPITRPRPENVERELQKLGDADALIDECVENIEFIEIV